ncbi:MAG: hypothetical protein ACLR2E_07665 [Lachnospiraceae bacterium]
MAAKCGYHDNSYFNRIFCRKYGTTPSNTERRIKNVPKINRPFLFHAVRAEALHHPDPFCPDPHAADPADPHAFLRKAYRGQRLKQRLLHRQRQQ